MAAESGHSVLTVADVLAIELLRDTDVSVAAAGHRLGNRVEWVHVFETPAVTGMLRGGEFLLTTGIALAAMTPAEVDALVAAVAPAGAAPRRAGRAGGGGGGGGGGCGGRGGPPGRRGGAALRPPPSLPRRVARRLPLPRPAPARVRQPGAVRRHYPRAERAPGIEGA